jgi:hypothetical protein
LAVEAVAAVLAVDPVLADVEEPLVLVPEVKLVRRDCSICSSELALELLLEELLLEVLELLPEEEAW